MQTPNGRGSSKASETDRHATVSFQDGNAVAVAHGRPKDELETSEVGGQLHGVANHGSLRRIRTEPRVIVADPDSPAAPRDDQRASVGHLGELLPGGAVLAEPEAHRHSTRTIQIPTRPPWTALARRM